MIRDILAVVDNADSAAPFIAQVLALAETHAASVEIVALTPSPYFVPELLPLGVMYLPDETLAAESAKLVAAVRALVESSPSATTVFGLHDDIAWLAGDLRRSRQIADMFVIGGPSHWETSWLRRRVCETLLFGGGTPTLLLPPGKAIAQIRHAVFGWKPSPEANRALHDLVAIAEHGAKVDIVIVDQDPERDGGDELVRHLTRHGLRPELHRVEANGLDHARVLHGLALHFSADLLVTGAFAHSRLRELTFGGVTRDLIDNTEVAVMLSH